jgi:hypothetical protein
MDQAVLLALKAMINRMVQDNLRPWLRSEMLERPHGPSYFVQVAE